MPKHQPFVSIITINYNQLAVTCEMLDSVRKLSYPQLEVIVIDNASQKNPQSTIAQQYPEVHFIRSEKNLGFSGGNNLGIEASKGEFLFFVNNDTELQEGCIERLLALFDVVPKLGMVSPLICYFPSTETEHQEVIQYAGTTPVNPYTARNRTIGWMEKNTGQYAQPVATPYAHGAAMMIPRRIVDEVGGMPEAFFLYYEELDWCEQIRRAGYQVYLEPRAKIYHKESVSVGKMSTLKTYYLTRNRIFFMRRNRNAFELLLFTCFLISFTIPKNVLGYFFRGEWTHLKAFLRAIWWNFSRQDRHLPADRVVNTYLSTQHSEV
ncbi:MAG: glycosyltransferase family 2 protein [Bacteroidota bacterium]